MNEELRASQWLADPKAPADLEMDGARLVRMHSVVEPRGRLTVAEMNRGLPFAPRRFFVISQVPGVDIRGEHAHRRLEQLLVCLAGSVVAEVSDGRRWRAVHLDCPDVGLYIPPMVWGAQHDYSREAVLLVLASAEYDSADYIRDLDTFRAERSRMKPS
ncbi:MAG TPA: FdtA/QdtA family cupin domain-containing protein [Usitatibacter sp.]|nr:FdtA/QdtA family cupin domain-containing protein [Usitatibacter sp.]